MGANLSPLRKIAKSMRILSLDTSFSTFNLSVVEKGEVKLIHYINSEKKTLELLPSALEELKLHPSDFDAFAVSIGVGYLTSLRIGVTFVKTIAYILKKPVVSYENLFLLAYFTSAPMPRIPYLAVSTNLLYRIYNEDHFSEVKIYKGEKLQGTGITVRTSKYTELTSEQIVYPFFPFSAYGGIYAYEKLKNNPEGDNLFSIEPLYIKPPV